MLAEYDEFRLLLERVQDGSQDAVCELIERYTPHVVRTVRRKLGTALRAKFDSFDFVQAVWASFFVAPQRLTTFHRPEELMAYLVRMARNKVVDEFRRRTETDKYDVNRERSLNDSTLHLASTLAARQPSPSEVAVAGELWSRLIEGLPAHYRHILELRRAGYTHEEIAGQAGVNEKTVRRVIQGILRERAE